MRKYEHFSKEELARMCAESESYRALAAKVGYNPDGGSGIRAIKEMIAEYELDTSHFLGQSINKDKLFRKRDINDYFTNKVKITSHKLRLRLLEEGYFEPKCSCCGLSEWMGNPIPLELHHKDGNKDNNALDNLELRCPNCHYFTDNYKSKNVHRE